MGGYNVTTIIRFFDNKCVSNQINSTLTKTIYISIYNIYNSDS